MDLIKKYLSYFYPISIKKLKGEYHSVLEVTWENGKLILNTENANYSYGSLHQVFKKAFHFFNLSLTPTDKVLILGFGAGSVKKILRTQYHFNEKITGVEFDKKIIELAYDYFKIPYNNQKFNLVYDDALHFIKQNNKQYSVIIVDLFKDIEVPEEFLQKTFFESLLKCKTKNGVIFFNFIENKNNESLHSLRNKFSELKITSEVFTQKLYGTTNYVLKLY